MPGFRLPFVALVTRFAARLRFPTLFALTGALFLLDLAIPDVLPFADELLLGLGTLLFASLRKRGETTPAEDDPAPEIAGRTD